MELAIVTMRLENLQVNCLKKRPHRTRNKLKIEMYAKTSTQRFVLQYKTVEATT